MIFAIDSQHVACRHEWRREALSEEVDMRAINVRTTISKSPMHIIQHCIRCGHMKVEKP